VPSLCVGQRLKPKPRPGGCLGDAGQSGRHELADRAAAKLLEVLERSARRDLFLLLVGRQARGRAWPNAAEAVLDYGCLEASKDAAIAGSRVPLDVVVEHVHHCSGGVAVKLDGDLIGIHPRQRIARNCPTATTRQVGMRRSRCPNLAVKRGRCLDHRYPATKDVGRTSR